MSYLGTSDRELVVEYGAPDGGTILRSASRVARARESLALTIDGLTPGTSYKYRVLHRTPGASEFESGPAHSFRTARPRGEEFRFTIQADSHRDDNSSPELYLQTLANVRADAPDFHVDLGDTFMCDKFARSNAEVVARYREERDWFGAISASTPLFLVNGNHEGEAGWLLNGTADNLAVWATAARQRYFLNPTPDDFYTGDTESEPFVGRRASFYAWEWGSAQFIVLDPFWFTKVKPGGRNDGWGWTLGERQYRWLTHTLEASDAPLRFVFLHHLLGGVDTAARGGTEAATLFEWGGRSPSTGARDFSTHRPGWPLPIHELLLRHGVSAVFHGHDHVYVRQELDGIVYQEVPQPSHRGENGPQLAREGGYREGTVLSSSGHLRVTVRARDALVEYVKVLGGGAAVAHAYTIAGRAS